MPTNIIKKFLKDLLFPAFCLGCQTEGTLLCQDCKSILEISEYTYCLCNKDPLRLPPENKSGKPFGTAQGKCPRCQDNKLAGIFSALSYKEKSLTRKLIRQFKYSPYLKELAKTLSVILLEHFILTKNNTDDIWENSILIPVPLEISRLKSRDYNQTEELAKELALVLAVPVLINNLVKIKKTRSQVSLSAKERQENVKNAFSVKKPEEIKNKKIFLIDDVYTTGATMQECARVLRDAGAKQVWGIAIAREG